MNSIMARVDRKGRLVIPKKVREELGIKEGGYVELRKEGEKIVLKPVKSVADKYFGVFNVEKWPEDLDEFLSKEVVRRWSKDM